MLVCDWLREKGCTGSDSLKGKSRSMTHWTNVTENSSFIKTFKDGGEKNSEELNPKRLNPFTDVMHVGTADSSSDQTSLWLRAAELPH